MFALYPSVWVHVGPRSFGTRRLSRGPRSGSIRRARPRLHGETADPGSRSIPLTRGNADLPSSQGRQMIAYPERLAGEQPHSPLHSERSDCAGKRVRRHFSYFHADLETIRAKSGNADRIAVVGSFRGQPLPAGILPERSRPLSRPLP